MINKSAVIRIFVRAVALFIIISSGIVLFLNLYEMYRSYLLCGIECFFPKDRLVETIRYFVDFFVITSFLFVSAVLYNFSELARVWFVRLTLLNIVTDGSFFLFERYSIGKNNTLIFWIDLLFSLSLVFFLTRKNVRAEFD